MQRLERPNEQRQCIGPIKRSPIKSHNWQIELSERAGNFRRLTKPELLDQSAADLRYVKQIIADLANGD